MATVKAPVCLIVIDGWGVSDATHGNAIKNANTPIMDRLSESTEGFVTLDASGLAVGLPDGLMGNSEVGHFTIGTGRVTYQVTSQIYVTASDGGVYIIRILSGASKDIVAIDKSINEVTFHTRPVLVEAFTEAKSKNGRVHFLGLVSDGGVHSHITHLEAFIEAAKRANIPNTFVHFFADGRDTSPTSGVSYVERLSNHISKLGYGSVATLMGRYYAMDRDKRYERTKLAYEGLTKGIGERVELNNLIKFMNSRYNATGDDRQTDEFMKPIILNPEGIIKDNDTLVFIDFRADRMRQIVEAIGIKPQFEIDSTPKNLGVYTMTEYKKEFPFKVVFTKEQPKNTLAEWLSSKSIPQFHCAETEKYAHVTFFFNGGLEAPFEGEERCLVPSPKVPTYDLQPEMNAVGVATAMVDAIKSGKYPFVMCNFAPPDMVGHTGKYDPAVKACAATDEAIGSIQKACEENGVILLVTADHGNAERMIDEDGKPVTKHTTFRVPFCLHGGGYKFGSVTHNASLADVAPTVLSIMGIELPKEMTGIPLVLK